jgi:threonine/homoserine/homoserine lactone efflux protein
MNFQYLINGMIIGYSASLPLGPIGILCIQKTINKGRLSGFVSGLGAATADTVYAIISGFGLTIISNFITSQQTYLRIGGAVVLVYLGIKIFFTNPGIQIRKQAKDKKFFNDFISIFFLTISNPISLFVFAAVFAGFGIVKSKSEISSITELVLGVLLGATLWWTTLTSLINLFRNKIRLRNLLWINKISGVLIIIFGIVAFVSLFYF